MVGSDLSNSFFIKQSLIISYSMTNLQSLRQRKFLDRPTVFEKFALTQVF